MTDQKTLTSSHWGAYEVTVKDDEVIGFEDFSPDPTPSAIGHNLPDVVKGDLRISQPMVRASWLENGPSQDGNKRGQEAFVPISWDKAYELVANEVTRVAREHGNQAIYGGSYGWASAGRFHHAQSQLHRFLNLAGGYTRSVNTYSSAAGEVIVPHVLGHSFYQAEFQATTWDMLAEHCDIMVMFGGMASKNGQVHPGGISRHMVPSWMARCKDRGTEFVNISPQKSDVDDPLQAQWLSPRPNTDVALMLGIAHTLWREGLHDAAYLARYATGFETFLAYLTGETDGSVKDAVWAADITGIPATDIETLARRMAGRACFISLSLSVQRVDHGEQSYWMAITLAAMLGQLGTAGGGVGFGNGALGGGSNPRFPFKGPTFPQGKNPVSDFIPVARVTDMLLNPGTSFDFNGTTHTYPDIRLVYWAGGNPFHHQMDLNKLVRAWQKPETVIVHEIYWNAMARHADIILPVSTVLERNDIGYSAADPYVIAMKQAIEPVGQAQSDFAILTGVAGKMDLGQAFTEGLDEAEWLRRMYGEFQNNGTEAGFDVPDFDVFWQKGYIKLASPEKPGGYHGKVYLKDFHTDPELSPLGTPSGRIEIFSETIESFNYPDCQGHPRWYEPVEWLGGDQAKDFPLHLLSNQPKSKLHSQMDHGKISRADKINGRAPVTLNRQDAAARGIADGDMVRLFNDRGACYAGAILSDDLMPGVLQLSTGAWFDPLYGNHPIGTDRHGNPNILTRDKGTSRLAQGPTAHTTLVEVEKAQEDLPEVRAFALPDITS
ncbi:molybdopterin-dependent oxidoreductase [Paremcibacter congregatus]|uniref:molybdopterin-dependent oxidoreductase n=1 Tax=Paremcibacter congregatus TaxID=2043170 RepID=UPI003A8DC594